MDRWGIKAKSLRRNPFERAAAECRDESDDSYSCRAFNGGEPHIKNLLLNSA